MNSDRMDIDRININAKINTARARSLLYRRIREFFSSRGYLEVETPSLSPDLIPEANIDCFGTRFVNEFEGSREMYLIPSPEVFMKRLIAHGSGSIFEISKCFRNCEQLGTLHNPEFSMLEYYTVGFDEEDSAELTKEFLRETAPEGCPGNVTAPWLEMTVRDAVLKYAGVDLDSLQDARELRSAAKGMGLHIPGPEPWDDTFNRIFCTFVEPSIPRDRPVMFKDYPRQTECLAVRSGNYRRRWELYINGIETANCYFEERDAETVREYYRTEYAKLAGMRAENGKVIPDADMEYAGLFETFPKCSGVAVGLDRLLMAQLGEKDIKNVLLFPFSGFLAQQDLTV